MHLSELSMGYGKFEYTREGVNHARGIYPMNVAGCAITSLNSPSDSEIHLSPSPQVLLQKTFVTLTHGVMQYGESCLYPFVVHLLSPDAVGIVARAILQHSQADPCNIAGNGMACVMFSYSLSQEEIVVPLERVVPFDDSKSSSLVDRLQHSAIPRFPSAATAPTAQFLVFNQSTVTHKLSAGWESPSIHDTSHNLHRSNGADAINLSLQADGFDLLGQLMKAALILLLAPAVQLDILLEDGRSRIPERTTSSYALTTSLSSYSLLSL